MNTPLHRNLDNIVFNLLSFLVPYRNPRVPCKSGIIPSIDLTKWADYDQYSPHQYVRSNFFPFPEKEEWEIRKWIRTPGCCYTMRQRTKKWSFLIAIILPFRVCLTSALPSFLLHWFSLCSNSSTTFPTLTIRSRQSTTIIVFISRKRISAFLDTERLRRFPQRHFRHHNLFIDSHTKQFDNGKHLSADGICWSMRYSFSRRLLFCGEKSSLSASSSFHQISFIDISIFETFSQCHDTVSNISYSYDFPSSSLVHNCI